MTYEPPDIQPISDLFDDLMEEHEDNPQKAMQEFAKYCHYDEALMERALHFAFDMMWQITPSEEEEAAMEEREAATEE